MKLTSLPIKGPELARLTADQPFAGSDDLLIASWLASQRTKNTQSSYFRAAKSLLEFAHLPLRDLGLPHLQCWQQWLQISRQLQPASINLYSTAIRGLFAFATRQGYIPRNIAVDLQPCGHKNRPTVKRTMSRDEIRLLIDSAANIPQRLGLKMIYVCGLRVSEFCAIRWRDFDSQQQSITLRVNGKGGRERVIRLPPELWTELLHCFPSDRIGERLWSVTRQAVDQWIRKAAKGAQLHQTPSAHWLRHSCASHLLESGWTVVEVRDYLGHASISTTNTYLHSQVVRSADELIKLP